MGIGKRIYDLARANLNALLSSGPGGHGAAGGAPGSDPLGHYSDDELRAELELRRARARRQEEGRVAREAAERAAREKLERERRDAERARAQGQQRTQRQAPPRSTPSPNTERRRLEQLYARLETPPGAALDTLRKNFRRLMRKYHPDLNGQSPAAQRAATERSMELTAAFNELERLLLRK